MKPAELIDGNKFDGILFSVLNRVHSQGPVNSEDLESLAYLKHFHNYLFSEVENKLMYLLGLFYKLDEPKSLIELAYSVFSEAIYQESGQYFTPVQASIRKKIIENRYFSFSAPTSAGKSFLFRELIREAVGDIVIVVPSRALIAEYLLAVREIVFDRNDILILQFVDDVNRKKTSRRIFVVTPERASEIFKSPENFNPYLFLFDEAQISEEAIRGIGFDAFVRRCARVFPEAKKIFAHPFVENPSAQLTKHAFSEFASAKAYKQNSVGKIYLKFNAKTGDFKCFSPFSEDPLAAKNQITFPYDVVASKLREGGSVLIYISKASIYDKSFEKTFERYISLCDLVENEEALSIINEIEDHIGAKNRKSEMIELLKRGVVIHHGSVPLTVRFLIEKFTNLKFARICFATSTLIQGVNMPFDIVWIENIRFSGSAESQSLGMKNLIGRAGRSTLEKNKFDYGFVIVKNINSFLSKFSSPSFLNESSKLDELPESLPDDLVEFVEAVRNNDFNDFYNLPTVKINRIRSEPVRVLVEEALNILFVDGKIINSSIYRKMSAGARKKLKEVFSGIFESSLGRGLHPGEKAVLSTAITVLLWYIQGKTFKQLLAFRYVYLTNQVDQRRIKSRFYRGEISDAEMKRQLDAVEIAYSTIPYALPDASLKTPRPSRFVKKKMKDFNYDLLVYDTYDFLDKVISFSLSDVFVAAFDQYFVEVGDGRARDVVNYFKYGTVNVKEIWLMRYGFSSEQVKLIAPLVEEMSADEIVFSESIYLDENESIRGLVVRYL